MPSLNVFSYIVEAVDDLKTQWALLTVCRQMSRLILPSMYRELSFKIDAQAQDSVGPLEKLAFGGESNPNLQFTTSLYFFTFSDEGNELLPPILPFLVNLRRLAIYSYFFRLDRLLLLPPTAKLTHLILRNIRYLSFFKVLESHPTLLTISVPGLLTPCENTWEQSDETISIPRLRSLTWHRFGHRPLITDACFTVLWRQRRQPISEQSKDQVVKGFSLARAAHFPDPFDFSGIVSLACRLESLEYLLLDTSWPDQIFKTPFNWNLLSATKLKYIRILGSIVTNRYI